VTSATEGRPLVLEEAVTRHSEEEGSGPVKLGLVTISGVE
jgi:hypothetical protein